MGSEVKGTTTESGAGDSRHSSLSLDSPINKYAGIEQGQESLQKSDVFPESAKVSILKKKKRKKNCQESQ